MTDPVLTPDGQSYERSQILVHLDKVGAFDPLSRRVLKKEELRANIGLRGTFLHNYRSARRICKG